MLFTLQPWSCKSPEHMEGEPEDRVSPEGVVMAHGNAPFLSFSTLPGPLPPGAWKRGSGKGRGPKRGHTYYASVREMTGEGLNRQGCILPPLQE